jgi:hypothetical protein
MAGRCPVSVLEAAPPYRFEQHSLFLSLKGTCYLARRSILLGVPAVVAVLATPGPTCTTRPGLLWPLVPGAQGMPPGRVQAVGGRGGVWSRTWTWKSHTPSLARYGSGWVAFSEWEVTPSPHLPQEPVSRSLVWSAPGRTVPGRWHVQRGLLLLLASANAGAWPGNADAHIIAAHFDGQRGNRALPDWPHVPLAYHCPPQRPPAILELVGRQHTRARWGKKPI